MESSTDQPASAMYSSAAALSLAVFEVVLPHSIAAAFSAAYCSVFAFAVADSEDIAVSKSLPTFTLAAPAVTTPVAIAPNAAPAICTLFPMADPTPPMLPSMPCALAIELFKLLSTLPAILTAI